MLKVKNIGGEMVGKGSYWNFSTGERVTIEDRGMLPGDSGQTYYRFSPVVILMAGPILGLAYAAFLPFIGIAMLVKVAGRKIFGGAVEHGLKGASFGWRPTEAYLGGKKGRKKGAEKKGEDGKEGEK